MNAGACLSPKGGLGRNRGGGAAGKACSRTQDTWGSAANQVWVSQPLWAPTSLCFFENGKLGSTSYLPVPWLWNSAEARASSVLKEKDPLSPPNQEALADLVRPLGTSSSLSPGPQQQSAVPSAESERLGSSGLCTQGWLTPTQPLGFCE